MKVGGKKEKCVESMKGECRREQKEKSGKKLDGRHEGVRQEREMSGVYEGGM